MAFYFLGGGKLTLYNDILNKKEKIAIIGLGYVGLPLAIEFAKKVEVIGFDINNKKIDNYINGNDVTEEVGNYELKKTNVKFTSDEAYLKDCKLHIVCVPTPINNDKTPNLDPIISATETIARNMKKGSIVVYESTVYPGTTEEICVPILEKISGLKYKEDFKVGYSPERINPGDKENKLTKIVKVVSGCDEESLEEIAKIYEMIITAGIYRAESIKVAESAKVIENSQRDINIAFMNEIAMVFNKMNIDTKSVLEAASTKWNFLNFTPGLVGGHCIGVDPYYFIYKAEELGYHSQIILSGRKINDIIPKYIAENTVKKIINSNKLVKNSKIGIMGITFKENCPDIRNSKVIDMINELKDYGVNVYVYDPIANKEDLADEFDIHLNDIDEFIDMDAIIVAVSHDDFKSINLDKFENMYSDNNKILIDVKGIFDKKEALEKGFVYWRL